MVLKNMFGFLGSLGKINLKDTRNQIRHCDVLFFCHDGNRGLTLSDKAYSSLVDSLRDDFELKGVMCFTIAHPWSKLTGPLAHGNPISMNRAYFFARMLELALGRFGVRPCLRLYKNIINSAQPSAIITIGCSKDLCEAARIMGVFHVELLHGIGYTAMPWGWGEREKRHLPQGVLSLDEVSTQTFSDLKRYDVDVKEIPHPFLRRFSAEEIRKLPQEWLPVSSPKSYLKEVLVSLQWGYASGIDAYDFSEGVLTNGLFYEDLEEVVEKTRDVVFWRFRFHPVQYRQPEKYKKLFDYMERFCQKNPNCEWKESTNVPLPSILLSCSGHITMHSMVSYECAYMGVPTMALGPALRAGGVHEELFGDLVNKGYLVKQASSVDAISQWVDFTKKREPLIRELENTWALDEMIEWLLPRKRRCNANR